jgi:hypothetical protein
MYILFFLHLNYWQQQILRHCPFYSKYVAGVFTFSTRFLSFWLYIYNPCIAESDHALQQLGVNLEDPLLADPYQVGSPTPVCGLLESPPVAAEECPLISTGRPSVLCLALKI